MGGGGEGAFSRARCAESAPKIQRGLQFFEGARKPREYRATVRVLRLLMTRIVRIAVFRSQSSLGYSIKRFWNVVSTESKSIRAYTYICPFPPLSLSPIFFPHFLSFCTRYFVPTYRLVSLTSADFKRRGANFAMRHGTKVQSGMCYKL